MLAGGGHDVAVAVVGGHGPARPGVDNGDHAQGEVGSERDGAPGVACLFSEHGCLLEADEAEDRDHGQDTEGAEPGGGQGGGGQGREAEVAACRMRQPGNGLDEDDYDLGGEQDAEHAAGDVDPQLAQHGNDGPSAQRPRPPRGVHMQVGGGLAGRVRAERAIQADLQERVRQQRYERGGHADDAADAPGDEGIERAAVGDVPGHRHVPGGEQGQDHRDDQEGGRDPGQAGGG